MNRRIGAMQPYLFPYLGYFQLIGACDAFVFLDDVQYIRRGWINRNFIRSGGRSIRFTLPVAKAPLDSRIMDVDVDRQRYERFRRKFFNSLRYGYAGAEYFDEVYRLTESVLVAEPGNVCELAVRSVTKVCEYLDIPTSFHRASELAPRRQSGRSGHMIALVDALGGQVYINPVAGVDLYEPARFHSAGKRLAALTPKLPEHLRDPEEGRALSVIDALMRFHRNYLKTIIKDAIVSTP